MKKFFAQLVVIVSLPIAGCTIDEPIVDEHPQVQITYPTAASKILDSTTVSIEASDDRGVVRVELYIDGHIPPGGVLLYEPYTYSWQTSLLLDSSSHVLTAKAYDNDSNMTASQPVTVVVNRFTPGTFTARMSADTLVKLSWIDNSSLETEYQVLQDISDSGFVVIQSLPPNSTSAQISGIFLSQKIYAYEVRALIGSIRSPASNTQFVSPVLPSPINFSFSTIADTLFTFSWIRSLVSFETRIEIEESRQGGTFSVIKTLPAGTTSASLPGNYKVGNTYSYRARAFSKYNASVYTSRITTDIPFPKPKIVGMTQVSPTEIRLQWIGYCTYEKGFSILRRPFLGGTYAELGRVAATDTTWNDNTLDTTQAYTYVVQAFTDSNKSAYSDPRNISYTLSFNKGSSLTSGSGAVNAVVFVPNSYTLIGGGDNNTLTFWDAPSGTVVRTIGAQAGGVRCLAVTTDGTTLAVGGQNNAVTLWNIASGTVVRTLSGHTGTVNGVAFSGDGSLLVSGGADATIRIWRVSDGVLVRTITGISAPVNTVAITADGSTLAGGSNDGTLKLWHTADGSLLNAISDPSIVVQSAAFSPSGSTIATGRIGNANPLMLWGVPGGNPGITFPWYGNDIYALAYRPDGSMLVCGYGDMYVRIWDPGTGFESAEGLGHTDKVLSVATSTNGAYVASGSKDATTRIWSWKKSWQ